MRFNRDLHDSPLPRSVPSIVRRRVALPLLAPLAMLWALASLPAAALSSSSPSVTTAYAVRAGNQVQPQRLPIKPHGYYHNTSVFGLQWSGWGAASATAHGTFTFQFCVDERCAVSPIFVDPATVTLSRTRRCRGRLSYTELLLHVEGLLPDVSFSSFHARLSPCRGRPARRRH
ncbi:MAG TPA: hypothetical protein VID29_09415 [Solirubrobacteraceae bacterium]